MSRLVSLFSAFILTGSNALAQSVNLDLSSKEATHYAENVPTSGVSIKVGRRSVQVDSGTALTPAQLLAVTQIVNSGKQTIKINNQGVANGGYFNVTGDLGNNIGDLVIPRGVKGLADFGTGGAALTGNLSNLGKLFMYSTQGNVSSGTVSAENITNQTGALISSILPGSLSNQLNASTNPFDLTLSATDSIINHGSILSSGSLTLSAANIVNTSIVGAPPALIQAAANVNLIAPNIINSSIISATTGDINIKSAMASNIAVNNTGGALSALNGNINVRDESFIPKYHFDLDGGDLFSKEVNINSGDGIVTIDAENVTGTINVNAGEAHVHSNGPSLQLGTFKLTGDPNFFNTDGDVVLNGDIYTNGGPLFIAAKGDVIHNGGVLSTASASGNGGEITIWAGYEIQSSGFQTGQVDNDNSSVITRLGPAAGGGDIYLSDTTLLSSESTAASGIGGDITMDANGSIYGPQQMTSRGTEQGGNVTLLAEQGISSGSIDASTLSGSGSSGNISIVSQTEIRVGRVESNALGDGNAGCISMSTNGLLQSDGGIYSCSEGQGQAGTIDLYASNLFVDGDISANAEGDGDAGTIITEVTSTSSNPTGQKILLPGGAITADANGAGNAGTITITVPDFFYIGAQEQPVRVSANATTGQPGNITIHATYVGVASGGVLSAVSNDSRGSLNIRSENELWIETFPNPIVQGTLNLNAMDLIYLWTSNTGSPLYFGNVVSAAGEIQIVSTGIVIEPHGRVIAGSGRVRLGSYGPSPILIGEGAEIAAYSTSLTSGSIVIGLDQFFPGVDGPTPTNTDVTTLNGAEVHFGTNGISALGPTNHIIADTHDISFYNNQYATGCIELQGDVTIRTGLSLGLTLDNLDLTDPDTLAVIADYKDLGLIGGRSANEIVIPHTFALSSLTALNIPDTFTVMLFGSEQLFTVGVIFEDTNPLRQVLVNGTLGFTNSSGVLNVNSVGSSFHLGATGGLSGSSSLTLSVNGDIYIAGAISAASLTIGTQNGSGGSIISSSQNIVTAQTINLTAEGSIGAAGSLLNLSSSAASFAAGGAAYIFNNKSFSISGSSVGDLNIHATSGSLTANGLSSALGSILLTGGDDVIIASNIVSGAAIAIVAGRNIKTTSAPTLIQARDIAGHGHDITFIAGANHSIGSSSINVTGNSAAGGSIDFTASKNIQILANSTCADCDGANVLMASFANGASGGKILLPTQVSTTQLGSEINSSGFGNGNNGNVTLLAGASSGVSVTTGKITADGGSGTADGTGLISITTAQPLLSPSSLSIDSDASLDGTVLPSVAIQNASVDITNNLSASGQIVVTAGGSINTKTGVIAKLDIGNYPGPVILSPDGAYAYATNSYFPPSVRVIRTSDNAIVATINLGGFGQMGGLAITPDGQFLYVVNSIGNSVTVIRTSDNTVVGNIAMGENTAPSGIAINPQGTYAYVTNGGTSTVSVIRLSDNAVVANFSVNDNTSYDLQTGEQMPSSPGRIVLDPTGELMYVLNSMTGSILAINTSDYTIAHRYTFLGLLERPKAFALDPTGAFLYVGKGNGYVSVVRTSDHEVQTSFAVGANISGLSVDPTGSLLQVTNSSTGKLLVYRTADNSLLETISLDAGPSIKTTGFVGQNLVSYIPNSGSSSQPPFNIPPGMICACGSYNPVTSNEYISVIRTPTLTAPKVTLNSSAGNIFASTNSGLVEAAANAGNITIVQKDSLTLGQSSAGNSFVAGTAGSLTVSAPVSGANIYLAVLHDHDIVLNSGVTADNALTLRTDGTGSISGPGLLSVTGTLNLVSDVDIGASGSPLHTSAISISFSAGGSVWLSNDRTVTIAGAAVSDVSVETTSGSIEVGTEGLVANDVVISSADSIYGAGVIEGQCLVLTADNGDIGSDEPLVVSSSCVQANAPQGNVNILDIYFDIGENTITLQTSSAKQISGGTFAFEANNAAIVTNAGEINANIVSLSASAAGGVLNLQHNVNGTNSGIVALASDASILSSNLNGQVFANELQLTSFNGDIGTANSKLDTSVSSLTFDAAGSAYISNQGSFSVSGSAGTNAELTSTTGSIEVAQGGLVAAEMLTINAQMGSVHLDTSVEKLVLNTTGEVSIVNDKSVIVSGTVGDLSLSASGSIAVGQAGLSSSNGIDFAATGGSISNEGNTISAVGELKLQTNGFEITLTEDISAGQIIADTTLLGAAGADVTIQRDGSNVIDLVLSKIDAGIGAVTIENQDGGIAIQDSGVVNGAGDIWLRAKGGAITGGSNSLVSSMSELVALTDGFAISLRTDVDWLVDVETISGPSVLGADISIVQIDGDLNIKCLNSGVGKINAVTENGTIAVGGTSLITGSGPIALTATGGGIIGTGRISSSGNLDLSTHGSLINLGDIRVSSVSATTTLGGFSADIALGSDSGSINVGVLDSGTAVVNIETLNGAIVVSGSIDAVQCNLSAINGTVSGDGSISAVLLQSFTDGFAINLTNLEVSQAYVQTNSGSATGANISLIQTNGDIQASGFAGSGSFALTNQNGSILGDSDSFVSASSINLSAANGDIGGDSAVIINAPVVQANAAQGSVNIIDTYSDSNSDTVTILQSGANTSTGTFTIEATDAAVLTNTGAIGAHVVVFVNSAEGGSLNLQDSVTGTNSGVVSLTSDGSIGSEQINHQVSALTVELTSLNGSIGAADEVLQTAADTLNFSAYGAAHLSNSQSVTVSGNAGSDVQIQASAGSITVGADGISSDSGKITLEAENSINGAGLVSANEIDLVASSGDIGSLNSNLQTSANNMTFDADGSAFISNDKSVLVSGSAGSNIDFAVSAGTLTVSLTGLSAEDNVSLLAPVIHALGLIEANGTVSVHSYGDSSSITIVGNAPTAHGIILFAEDGGTITLPTNILSAQADLSGDGGIIDITAGTLSYAQESTSALYFDASGNGGAGGTVSLRLSNPTSITIGNSAGNFNIDVSGTSGGSVSVTAEQNLTINSNALNTTATDNVDGDGADICFVAGSNGSGKLLVLGNLNASGGTNGVGGSITLTSNSSTAFLLKNITATNGITGTISVAGGTDGSLSVTNLGGGIVNQQLLNEVSDVSFDTISAPYGDIKFKAAVQPSNSLSLASSGKLPGGTYVAPIINLATTSLGIKAKVNTSELHAATDGKLTIKSVGQGPIIVNGLSAGSVLSFKAVNEVNITGDVSSSGSISIYSTNGPIAIAGGSDFVSDAGVIKICVGSLTPVAGSFPSGVNFQVDGVSVAPSSPPFYFGKTGIDAGSDPSSVTMNSVDGGKIIFNTGTLGPSGILMDSASGDITFTAKAVSHDGADSENDEYVVDTGADEVEVDLLVGSY